MNRIYSIVLLALIISTSFGVSPLQITYVSSTRGVGVMLEGIPDDLALSTRRSGNLLLLTLVSDKLQSIKSPSLSADVPSGNVSQIAARVKDSRLEIVFSMDNPKAFNDVSFKSSGNSKGMLLLSRKKSTPFEVTLGSVGASKVEPKVTPSRKTKQATKATNKSTTDNKKSAKKVTATPKVQVNKSQETSVIVFVTKNNINIRKTPNAGKDGVIGRYPIGSRFVSSGKKGDWYSIILGDGSAAWVHESVAQDSSSITADVWDAIYNKENVEENQYSVAEKVDPVVEVVKPIKKRTKTRAKKLDVEGAFSLEDSDVESVTPKELQAIKDSSTVRKEAPKKVVVAYREYGRDPFIPLDNKTHIYRNEDLPNIENIVLVGILYDEANGIGLFEEVGGQNAGTSFTLMKGDAVIDGKVLQIFPGKVVFLMQEFDYSYTVEQVLKSQKE